MNFYSSIIYVTGAKLESATFRCIKFSIVLGHLVIREESFSRNLSYYELKGHIIIIKDEQLAKQFFLIRSVCKQFIWKGSGKKTFVQIEVR